MIVLKNLVESFITSAIDASATQITVPADHAGNFPSLLTGDNFRCALVNPATEAVEYINVTARENNVLTVVRGQEGTAALSFPVESRIQIRMTAKTWEEMTGECWMRPKKESGDVVLPKYESADSFSLTGDFTSFFTENRAVKSYPNKSVGFVKSAAFADGVTTVKVIEMIVPSDLTHVEAGLDPDALARRTLSNEELLGYMTPIPVLEMETLEVDGGALVSGTIKHPEAGKTYPASTEFHFNLPDGVTDFSITGQTFKMRMPAVTEQESPKTIGPITCRAAQLSLILSDPSNAINLSVRYVAIKTGVTLAYADTEAGYPGADVNADGALLPATSAGLDNPTGKSIVSGTAEFEIVGGKLTILNTSTATSLKSKEKVAQGDIVVTDQSVVTLGKVTEEAISSADVNQPFKDGSCIAFYKFDGDGVDQIGGQNFTTGLTYTSGKYGQAAIATPTNTVNVPIDKHSVSFVWTTRSGVAAEDSSLLFISGSYFGPHYGYWYDLAGRRLQDWVDALADGQFHTICAVHSASESRAYVDGVLKYTGPAATTGAGRVFSQIGYGCSSESMYYDQLRIFNRVLTEAEITKLVTENISSYASDISSGGFTSIPTTAIKADASLKIGAGTVGEYLGPKKELALKSGSSTKSSIVVVGEESIKDKILKADGLHKTILIDDVEVEVASVVETTTPITTLTAKRMSGGIALGPVIFKDGFEGAVVVAPGDHRVKKVWGPTGTDVAGMPNLPYASDGDANTGIQNTDILAALSGYEAAKYCKSFNFEGHSDYFLANINMMKFICDNHELIDAVDTSTANKFASLAGDYLWSSTEQHPDRAHRMRPDSYTDGQTKTIAHWVVPCRRISTGEFGSVVTSTITPKTALSKVPTTAAIPDRCTTPLTIDACVISGNALKYTCAKVPFSDPKIKRLSLSFSGDSSLRVKAAKIYTEEGA